MNNYKHIPFEHLFNCRDLGGYACEDGKFFAFHKIYRADLPATLTEEEWNRMREMNVRTIIDLRSLGEQKMTSYQTPEGIRYISFPLMKVDAEAEKAMSESSFSTEAKPSEEEMRKIKENMKQSSGSGFAKSLTQQYEDMLEETPERVAGVLNLIGEHISEGAVLYHCSVGKDRTGITSAMIYLLCGVSEPDIIADYQVSEGYIKQNETLFSFMPKELHHLLTSKPEAMEHFLKLAKERNYIDVLYANGLKESAVAAIRAAVME